MSLSDPSSLVFVGTSLVSAGLLVWILFNLRKHYREAGLQFTLILGAMALLFVVHEVFELLDFGFGRNAPGLSENLQNVVELAIVGILAYLISQ